MQNRRPNIIVLLTDQFRYDAASCNHQGRLQSRTPAIDGIADRGIRLTRAYTPISLCSPARGSLMTGLYPHNHGQLANMGNFNSVFDRQILDKVSWPQLLHEAGYATGCVGKWNLPSSGDEEQWGFQEWHMDGQWQRHLADNGIAFERGNSDVQRLEWGPDAPFCGQTQLPAEKTQEAWVADKTIDFIERNANAERPFAIYASFFGPHFPYAVPAPYDSMYDPEQIEPWGNFHDQFINKPSIQQKEMLRWNATHLTWPDWQKVISHYWGYCSFIDDQISRILDCLRDKQIDDDTVIIFSADHGDMLGSHRVFNKGMQMYEETHHIPMVIRWPGVTEPESECHAFVSLVDIMPTLLDMAGVDIPEDIDGRVLTSLLQGAEEDWSDDVYAEFHGYEPALCSIRMVRTESWKYVYNPCSEDELYDMKSDPYELNNVAGQLGYGHVLRHMKHRLVRWLRQTNDSIISENSWRGSSYDLYLSGRER